MLRRSLLTSAIAASLLTTFSLPAFATQVYETDLVIIGGGLSGLAAAQSAVDQGAKPIVLEKEAAWAAETSLKEVLASAPVIRRNTTSTPPLTRFLLPL
ncbi:FAD-binding protein [Parasutterella sp.]|uniref:FAD-binding protein n=1 Tax=Parasutterella sp. TaxID=2049037 RepID=UPI003AB1754F